MWRSSTKLRLLTGGFIGAVAMGAVSVASNEALADAYALSHVEIRNLLLTTSDQNGPFAQGDATNPGFVFTDRTSASATGFAAQTNFDTAARTSPYSFASPDACKAAAAGDTNACADADVSFSGAGPAPAENAFAPLGKGGVYGYGDSSLFSTAINPASGPTDGGAVNHIAEASATGAGIVAQGQAGESVQEWRFALNLDAGEEVAVSFDLGGLMRADESDLDALVARSTFRFTIALLFDGQEIDSDTFSRVLSPDGVNVELDLSTLDTQELSVFAGTGGQYEFVITSVATAEVQSGAIPEVPEPGTLGLLGAGLLGLGVAMRRRKRVAA